MHVFVVLFVRAWALHGVACNERAIANVTATRHVAFAALNASDVCAQLRVRTGAPWLPSKPACLRAIHAGMRVWAQPGTLVRVVPLTAEATTVVTFEVGRSGMTARFELHRSGRRCRFGR